MYYLRYVLCVYYLRYVLCMYYLRYVLCMYYLRYVLCMYYLRYQIICQFYLCVFEHFYCISCSHCCLFQCHSQDTTDMVIDSFRYSCFFSHIIVIYWRSKLLERHNSVKALQFINFRKQALMLKHILSHLLTVMTTRHYWLKYQLAFKQF